MNIIITNDFHDSSVRFNVCALSEKDYRSGKTGYFINKHANSNYADYYFRLSAYQTGRLFAETCGSKDCTCHKFTLQGFTHAEFSRSRLELTIDVMSVCTKTKNQQLKRS